MRYMMLVYSAEPPGGLKPEDAERVRSGHVRVMDEATRKGVFMGAGPLAPTSTATTVRIENGKALVTDGPFAETKEQLAGYYMIDVPDLDAALSWAARCPGASFGAIEVRPVWTM